MDTHRIKEEEGNNAFVLLKEDGSVTQLPWDMQLVFNDKVIIVELAFDLHRGILSINAVTELERARRCIAIGEYETKEMLEEEGCSLRGLVETVLEYSFNEVPSREAATALCNALFSDITVRVAYYWEAE